MRIIWPIKAANGTYTHNFTLNTDQSIEDINTNAISYAFYSDTNWTTPVAAPTAGTMTWTGQDFYPDGVITPIPVVLVSNVPSNVVDFSVSGSSYGFTFLGKCMFYSVVVSGISGTVGSMKIIINRYTGGS